jgi:hypothetical protein
MPINIKKMLTRLFNSSYCGLNNFFLMQKNKYVSIVNTFLTSTKII